MDSSKTSRSWNRRFDETVHSYGFVKNEDEPCVYKMVSGSKTTFLVRYVDDILLIRNDIWMLISVKIWLSKDFLRKRLRRSHQYILGIRVYRDRLNRVIRLFQSLNLGYGIEDVQHV